MKPFLVETVGGILRLLSKLSIFDAIMLSFPLQSKESNGALTEMWVVGNFVLAIFSLCMFPQPPHLLLVKILSCYPLVRILEIAIYQFYTQIYGGYRGKEKVRVYYTVLSYRRSIILAFMLYVEVLAWFATLYKIHSIEFSSKLELSDPIFALYYSAVTMTTIGYGDITASTRIGASIVSIQSLIGLFMTLLILARIINYLPKPYTKDPIEFEPEVPPKEY